MNFSGIATEVDKDEDKASLPDTEVGEVEAKETAAENAEKNVEEETPETAAKQGEPEKMDTTVREDKLDTTVREDKMDTTVQGDKMDIIVQEDMDPANRWWGVRWTKTFAVSFCDFLVCKKNTYTICVKAKSKSKKLYLFRSYPT